MCCNFISYTLYAPTVPPYLPKLPECSFVITMLHPSLSPLSLCLNMQPKLYSSSFTLQTVRSLYDWLNFLARNKIRQRHLNGLSLYPHLINKFPPHSAKTKATRKALKCLHWVQFVYSGYTPGKFNKWTC